MAMSWSFRRKALYYGVAIIVAIIVALAVWKVFFTHTPTCSDGIMNGTELGIDCGGACSLICSNTAIAPKVQWARAFSIASSTYTAAAYIQNLNAGAGARNVRYSFQLFDDKNVLVVEKTGIVDLPPVRNVPIIESNINVGNREVARTLFSFSDTPVWIKVTTKQPTLELTQQTLSDDGSRLSAMLVNDSLNDVARVTVAAVLFDSQGVARAASKTIIAPLPRKSSKSIYFTWPGGIPDVVRAEMTILPSF
ncbi:MAG TPA: hypothetical protein VHD31_03840 [Candidatus Paceibacterota bacterium]|nr:hypothetical protein [Candidatus Paceibacterota bacterium]